MLVMSILAPRDACDYETIEKKYFTRNGRVTWSELDERWSSDDGRHWVMPDRWRIWDRWCQLDLSSYVTWFRGQGWVHQILSRMNCPPEKFDVFTPRSHPPASSIQQARQRSRSRTPLPKKRPRPPSHPPPEQSSTSLSSQAQRSRSRTPLPKQRPCPPSHPPPEQSSTSLSSQAPPGKKRPCPPSHPPPEQSSTSSSSQAPPGEVILKPTSKFKARSKAKPLAPSPGAPTDAATSSVQRPPLFDGEPEYEEVCKHFGVWETVQEQEEKAKARADRSDSPEPDRESAMWGCTVCGTFNTVHNLKCSVASCMTRRPLLQHFRADLGDWFCPECNNHNRGYRKFCNWTACPSNDWVCECGNLNRSNRKFCQRRICGRRRPFDFD